MKKRFLLFVKGTKETTEATKLAARMAHAKQAELHLFTVIDSEHLKEVIYQNIINDYKSKITNAIEKMHDFIYKSFPDLVVKTNLLEGNLLKCTEEFIEKNKKKFQLTFLGPANALNSATKDVVDLLLKHNFSAIMLIPQEIKNSVLQQGIL